MESIAVYYLLVRTTFLRIGGDWNPVTDNWSQPRPLSKTILKFQVCCPDSVFSLWHRDAASSIVSSVQSYSAFSSGSKLSVVYGLWGSTHIAWNFFIMTSKALHYRCISHSLSATPSYFGRLPVWLLNFPCFVGCCYYLDWPISLFLTKYSNTYFARSRLIGQSTIKPTSDWSVYNKRTLSVGPAS